MSLKRRIDALEKIIRPTTAPCHVAIKLKDGTLVPRTPGERLARCVAAFPESGYRRTADGGWRGLTTQEWVQQFAPGGTGRARVEEQTASFGAIGPQIWTRERRAR